MIRNLAIISSFLFSLNILGQTETLTDSTGYDDCLIKKNGIYYAELDKETNIYIRFHDGDTVVTTSSENNLKHAAVFVNKDLGDGMLIGKYFTSDRTCSIRIKAKNDFGRVKMDGFIADDKIMMSVVNIEDNTARDFIFHFLPTPVNK